ncbi:hypothetical protein [Cellulomonas cellasea]|uniref:Uncharacterized protein n=2 Tax=Cellulomonas cellasea TaxID=43670 RepID=A0A0A0BC18_9CELL|nr:hypothetical protein [Cellulomonas cellasea]KGM03409.1 hypothetical protein Q760_04025 [Cellulomonas cellasea DSM 20118]GEA90244.1 hypothetical protein CCE01nite_41930 [Cellulomonas cellasea]
MSSQSTVYTTDGQWKLEAYAFKSYLVVYSSIGSGGRTFHWERQRRWFDPWYHHFHWVEQPVEQISVSTTYAGILPRTVPGAAHRSASGADTSSVEEKIWAVGIGVSIDATAGTGGPDWGTASPGGMPKLDVRGVRGHVTARIAGETLSADVEAGQM